ncbi:S41 family peptidase [Pedobacter duraquae]|uniref:Tricorn protease-like protein n=1 Tax=Pedobacter duraquae TaxID=425511 RepID=A0A4R6ICH5_9SPHI|nr:S41 family peptidase [Pedobacter duraquae]TDO19311.1 tricorn protease-like protein [Pedobacter duraquae]
MKQKLQLLTLLISLQCTAVSYAQNATKDAEAAKSLRERFQSGSAEISNYNTACYLALEGDKALALTYLKKAIYSDGFSNLKTIENDTDLISLHSDPQWASLVKAVADKGDQSKKVTFFYNQPAFWESKALKTSYAANISADEKVAGLSKFWSEAKYNFVNFDLIPNLNFDSLYFAYLPKVRETKSTYDYYRLMSEFCAQLKDGHTNVFAPDALTNEVYSRPLLRSRLIENKVLIVGVFDKELEKQGITLGQEILSVNGLPVKEYAAKNVTPYQSASTPQDQDVRSFEYSLFSGSSAEPIKLELADAAGRKSTYTINRIKPADRPVIPGAGPFEFKMLKGNVAYIALNGFDNDSCAKAFAKNFPEISKADAIIFDVRNNGGGSSSVGWNILSYLIDKAQPISAWYTRDYKPSYRAWQNPQQNFGSGNSLQPNGKFLYTKPVIVLTGPKTYSAAEDFAAAFKSLNRGLVLGKASGGSSGQPLSITLPGDLSARICTKRDKLANGTDFVGIGVLPDKVVGQTVADFRKGIDTDLEAALKELKK